MELVTEFKTTRIIRNQLHRFLDGFYKLVPFSLITFVCGCLSALVAYIHFESIFNEKELELLISGLPSIDVEDWRKNTTYTGFDVSTPAVKWFWEIVASYTQVWCTFGSIH